MAMISSFAANKIGLGHPLKTRGVYTQDKSGLMQVSQLQRVGAVKVACHIASDDLHFCHYPENATLWLAQQKSANDIDAVAAFHMICHWDDKCHALRSRDLVWL